ncbi:helix-turn-helix domain-containing protein [Deinococcus humi]|uniref:Excisionase family DNA binding protein n=1 Tax=Deinococcus humi TaxID=662880 RepID=A0A7W8NF77_9DEIO|nr:helix-turn-helix domain-containing protein [Deinococcus humi]MBB5362503.1 excisionase family DNA binding protein [Deinococcus humi]GGO28505.1 hypothetical protein GCM10008949_21180 [Deinococcus humi]
MLTGAELDQIADRIAAQLLAADVLTVEEAAQLLRLHPNTIRDQATADVLPGFKFGKKCWRFRRSALVDTIAPAPPCAFQI